MSKTKFRQVRENRSPEILKSDFGKFEKKMEK
jgi:hypothetical protein